MAGRTRTTKKLAQRIDLNYFKRAYPIPRWKRILSIAAVGLGVAWLGWAGLTGKQSAFNAGPLAQGHTIPDQQLFVLSRARGRLRNASHRDRLPGLPQRADASGQADLHAGLHVLPRRTSGGVSSGRDQRGILHPVPRQPEDHRRENAIRRQHLVVQQRTSGVRRSAAGARARSWNHQAQPPGALEERSEGSQWSRATPVRRLPPAFACTQSPWLRSPMRNTAPVAIRWCSTAASPNPRRIRTRNSSTILWFAIKEISRRASRKRNGSCGRRRVKNATC